jgi:hypothetical protein
VKNDKPPKKTKVDKTLAVFTAVSLGLQLFLQFAPLFRSPPSGDAPLLGEKGTDGSVTPRDTQTLA